MDVHERHEVINLVQSVLDNSLSTRLNKSTHMQVFTEHAETTLLALMLKDNVPVNSPLDFIKAQKLMEVEKLSKAMTKIHAQVAEKDTRDRKADIPMYNDKTLVRSPNFQVGNYVLAAEQRKSGTSKLVKWKGPRHVASVESDYVVVVDNLFTKELKAAHATRLRFDEEKEFSVTVKLAHAAEDNDHELHILSKTSTHAIMNKRCFTSCQSRGAVSPLERPPWNRLQLWLRMFRRWWPSSWSLKTTQA
jgi:hypothetical protein